MAVLTTEFVMMTITQEEVRRHPRWKEELRTPLHAPRVYRVTGATLLGIVAVLIATATAVILLLN